MRTSKRAGPSTGSVKAVKSRHYLRSALSASLLVFAAALFKSTVLHTLIRTDSRDVACTSAPIVDLMREVVLNAIYYPVSFNNDGNGRHNNAFAMTGRRRLENIRSLVGSILLDDVPGHIIETGCWKGGAMFYAGSVLQACGELGKRRIYLADSFSGIPAPVEGQVARYTDAKAHTKDLGFDNSPELTVERLQRLLLPREHFRLVVGFFNESLPSLMKEEPRTVFSMLRLDGDTYFSTYEALETLYDRISIGGFVIVDDFMDWASCREAIFDFRTKRNIVDPIMYIYHTSNEVVRGIWWRKHRDPCSSFRKRVRPLDFDELVAKNELPKFYPNPGMEDAAGVRSTLFNGDEPNKRLHHCV